MHATDDWISLAVTDKTGLPYSLTRRMIGFPRNSGGRPDPVQGMRFDR